MRRLGLLPFLLAMPLRVAAAQDPALVGALAPILMTEDRRVLDPGILGSALEHPDPVVRRAAVVAVGRIGAADGVVLLLPRLMDRDPGVVADVFFALGLLKQDRAVDEMLARLQHPDSLRADALEEAAIALARIGGDAASAALADVMRGTGNLPIARRDAMRPAAILESWRLGRRAAVDAIEPFTRDTGADLRWRAAYALGRLAAPSGGEALLTLLRDPNPLIRATAARGLVRRLADTAGIAPAMALAELQRLFDDQSAGARINALDAAATYRDSTTAPRAIGRLGDPDRNVRVAAASALASMGGQAAATALATAVDDDRQEWAVRRAALLGLARLDTTAFAARVGNWSRSADVADRLVAMDGWELLRNVGPAPFRAGLADADPRVRAAALSAWARAGRSEDREEVRAAALGVLNDPDPGLRNAALGIVADSASDETLDRLAQAWQRGPDDVRETILNRLVRWGRADRALLGRLGAPTRRALLERPASPVLRGIAARGWPLLAARWGGVAPIETGRTLQDYRELAARFYLASQNPHVTIDVQGRGKVELELLAHDAPLTVANFLRLVDRHYFDNVRWHRVVPNFVVQDGDPTGTGEGGPGWAIRDEINRRHYDVAMVGMALSGPDTGGSQWFINLSPQPHLDGGYTIFGKVVGGQNALVRILQGDRIRTIQRTGPP